MARYSRDFFELQIRFVQSLGKALDCRSADILYNYTMFRGVLSSDWLVADDPRWKEFVDGFEVAADPLDWTFRFYLRNDPPEPIDGATTYRKSKLFR